MSASTHDLLSAPSCSTTSERGAVGCDARALARRDAQWIARATYSRPRSLPADPTCVLPSTQATGSPALPRGGRGLDPPIPRHFGCCRKVSTVPSVLGMLPAYRKAFALGVAHQDVIAVRLGVLGPLGRRRASIAAASTASRRCARCPARGRWHDAVACLTQGQDSMSLGQPGSELADRPCPGMARSSVTSMTWDSGESGFRPRGFLWHRGVCSRRARSRA